jgi:hypothetical protein
LSVQTKKIIAVAVARVTQCLYASKAIRGRRCGTTPSDKELMGAIWVAAEMRAYGSYARWLVAIDEMQRAAAQT